jgi:hypothetical protein
MKYMSRNTVAYISFRNPNSNSFIEIVKQVLKIIPLRVKQLSTSKDIKLKNTSEIYSNLKNEQDLNKVNLSGTLGSKFIELMITRGMPQSKDIDSVSMWLTAGWVDTATKQDITLLNNYIKKIKQVLVPTKINFDVPSGSYHSKIKVNDEGFKLL